MPRMATVAFVLYVVAHITSLDDIFVHSRPNVGIESCVVRFCVTLSAFRPARYADFLLRFKLIKFLLMSFAAQF